MWVGNAERDVFLLSPSLPHWIQFVLHSDFGPVFHWKTQACNPFGRSFHFLRAIPEITGSSRCCTPSKHLHITSYSLKSDLSLFSLPGGHSRQNIGGGLVAKSCPTLVTLWTVACQAPLSMGFSRQEYWCGLRFLLQGLFLTQGSNLDLLHCRQILYCLSRQGSPQGLKCLSYL